MQTSSEAVLPLLDATERALQSGQVGDALTALVRGLSEIRGRLSREAWLRACTLCRDHNVCALLHQNPQLRRSFERPRGYAGDALVIDYCYQYWDGLLAGVTPLGLELLYHNTRHPDFVAMRARCALGAELIDQTSFRKPGARVLAVACGHLREADLSVALHGGLVAELVALDQDPSSIELIVRIYGALPVTPLRAKIRDLLQGRLEIGRFDLIYSLGLYDYLDDPTARTLTRVLYEMLEPGGRLVAGNCLPEMESAGYGESFGNWHLILRAPDRVRALADQIEGAEVDTFADAYGTVVHLSLTKRRSPQHGR